jgi:ATP-dependent Lhr-like helicase
VEIEEALKAGRLPAVVATSSLELGIDMGAVDLVIQVESPPSVASGLQRTGRAGHNVGDVSRGVIFPKYQGDLVQAAVVARRMRGGQIESLSIPRNPLDVLAQQIVAMTALDDWSVDDLHAVVRRAAPFASLTRPVLEAVLDMLAGRYPSEEFAELRPRPHDRHAARPPRGPAAGGDQRRHHSRPRPVRRVPGRLAARRRPELPPGRRARRGNGLRVAGR